jgi:hypothetical protein
MTTNGSTPPATLRWDDPDGSWWIIAWDPERGGFDATKFTHGDAGEERIVDDVGFGATRITTVDELVLHMNRKLPPEVVTELEAAAGPAPVGLAPPSENTERPMGARYRLDLDDGTWWELGWDKPLGTFFATRLADDEEVGHRVLEDFGNHLSEIANIAHLGRLVRRPIPPQIAQDLAGDAVAHPFTSVPRYLPEAEMLVITPDPSDGSAQQAELARWEARLRAQEAQLEAWAAALTAQTAVEPLWTLPSAPVVDALRNLQQDMAGDGDLATFAIGLGLDVALVDDLRANQLPESLDIGQISRVCEALRCSPYDLWGPDLAQRILHAYGPEQWPTHIEPLADGRELSGPHDEFIARRLDADVARMTGASTPPSPKPEGPDPCDGLPPRVSAVCYRREGLLVEEPGGAIRDVDSTSDASPGGEAYHFRFRQVTEPRDVLLYPPNGIGDAAPAGHDADPALANTAESFRKLPWLPNVDMVRFVDTDGHQEWLGWNPEPGMWEAWEDPRIHYPGDPTDILDSAGFTDPAPVAIPDITNTRTESVEMDERLESTGGTWKDDGPDHPDLPLETNDTVSLADLDL